MLYSGTSQWEIRVAMWQEQLVINHLFLQSLHINIALSRAHISEFYIAIGLYIPCSCVLDSNLIILILLTTLLEVCISKDHSA